MYLQKQQAWAKYQYAVEEIGQNELQSLKATEAEQSQQKEIEQHKVMGIICKAFSPETPLKGELWQLAIISMSVIYANERCYTYVPPYCLNPVHLVTFLIIISPAILPQVCH